MTTLHGTLVAILSGPVDAALTGETLRLGGEPLVVAASAGHALIERLICNRVDALVVADEAQLRWLLHGAARLGLHGPLLDALNHETVVAAADERCARALWERGIQARVAAGEPGQVLDALAAYLAAEIARGRRPDPAALAEAV